MITVIFGVTPKDGQKGNYLDIAATIRPMVEKVEGFISVERFQSPTNPEKLLFISCFEDEAAPDHRRNTAARRSVQSSSRAEIFANYHLRICKLIRDYDIFAREEALADN